MMKRLHLRGTELAPSAGNRPTIRPRMLFLKFLALSLTLHSGGCASDAERDERTEAQTRIVAGASDGRETIYTCSMHPGVRQNEPGDCPICGMDLIEVPEAGGAAFADKADALRSSERAHAQDSGALGAFPRMAKAVMVDPARPWSGPGRLEADPSQTHVVSLDASAFVIHAGGWIAGDEVTKGDLLMEVESTELTGAARDLALISRQATDGKVRTGQVASDAERRLRRAWVSPRQIQQFLDGEPGGDTLRIVTEVDGVVLRAISARRQTVQARVELFAINDLSEMIADVDAFGASASDIMPGDTVAVRLLGGAGGAATGIVHSVQPRQTQSGYALGVRVRVPNPGRALREGMKVVASGASRANSPGVHIPVSSVLWTGRTSWVFKKNGEHLEAAPVVLGARHEELVHVIEGISEGEEVVLNGTFFLDSTEQLSGARSRFAFSHSANQTRTGARALLDAVNIGELLTRYARWTEGLTASSADSANSGLDQTLAMLAEDARSDIFRSENLNGPPALATLEENRRLYKRVSDLLIEALPLSTGVPSDSVYVQYCPMAFGDQGARWLSFEREILNPYFGDAMLRCGETVGLRFLNSTP